MKDCAPRPSSLILAAVFAAAIGRGAFGLADTPRLLFHAPFDGTATAAVAAGNPEPLVANALEWGCGRLPGTKALRMRGAPSLAYAAAGNLPRESGTVALWTRREWDFSASEQPWRCLFATPMPGGDRDKKRIGSGALWFWWNGTRLRADQSDAKDRYAAVDGIPPSTNWLHLAFSWRPERVELFVNGERRRALRDGDSPIRDAIAEAECAAHPLDRSWIDRFFVGNINGGEAADALVSDLRIYDAPLTEEQVRALVESGQGQSTAIDCNRLQSTAIDSIPFAIGRHERPALPGEAPGTIAPEALELAAGWVARPEAAPPSHAGGQPAIRHLAGVTYLEAGTNRGDRFAIPLALPAGVPLFLVEIDVPDDALRTEDLILQPAGGETDYAMQVGLLLGGEYPNSGAMLTHRCLYWARTNDVALVAMTARAGAPAAVAAVRAYTVKDATLPAAFHGESSRPDAQAAGAAGGRSAALYYEDPALNFGFGFSTREAGTPEVFAEELSRLAATMKFASLDTLFYPGAWYQGLIEAGGYNPRHHAPRWRETLYAAFDAEGLRFVPTVNLNNIPWEPGAVTAASLADGSLHASPIAIHDTGKPNPGLWHNTPPNYNFLHPDVQGEIGRIFDALVAEGSAHPSFGGVCLHLTQHCCLWWGSDRSGYNDYTVEAFCRDTGIVSPSSFPVHRSPDSSGPRFIAAAERPQPLRGAAYAEWLRSDPALWNAWLQWRCDQVTAFYASLAARLAAAHPGAKLYLNNFVPQDVKHPDFASDPDFARNAARRCGLDIPALERAIPNLVVMQTSIPADYRWGYVDRYFRFDNPDKREDAIARIRDLDATPGFWEPLGEASRPWANIHDRYWESPIGAHGDSLSHDGFVECKWRVSTLNPGGANMLRHWLAPLRHHDVLGLSKGGFLVGTYGMEAQLAPFLSAFRSLPPVLLPELPESTATVKVRGGEWHGTNWVYAVNTGATNATVALPSGPATLAPYSIQVFSQP